MNLHADALATITAYQGQTQLRQRFLDLLDSGPQACLRTNTQGHITASGVVVDATASHVLLTLHPKVGRWIQLGGHCESTDSTLAGAALRESREESGIIGLRVDPSPIQLAITGSTCYPDTQCAHFDVRFLIRAPVGAEPTRSSESLDMQWWPIDGVPSNVDDLEPMIESALARLG